MNPNSSENSETNPANTLSGSERRDARWDLQNAFRNYSVLVVSQVISAICSFVSVLIITRYLGTEEYGGVVAVIAASQIAQIFVNWTCVALARFGVEEFVKTGEISQSFWARSLIFLPNTIVLLLFSWLWLPLVSTSLKLPTEAAWLVVGHFVVVAVWLHVQHALQGAKLPKLQAVLIATERILVFSTILVLALTDRLTYVWAISAYIASPFLMILVGLFQIRKLVSWRFDFERGLLTRMLRFSIPLIPFSLIGYFTSSYLDAIFIAQYLSKADLGVYSVAYQMNGILMQFPLLAGTLLLPLFVTLQSAGNTEKMQMFVGKILPLIVFLWGLGGIVAAFFLQFFLPVVFGPELDQAVVIFWIFVSSAAFAIPGLVGYVPYFNAKSATYVATVNAIVSAVVNVIANFLLIPRYGLKGCAWATVLAYGTGFLVTALILRRRFKIELNWTIPAIFPVLAGSLWASWTEAFGISLMVSSFCAGVVILVFWRSFAESLKELANYRTLIGGS